MSKIEHSSGEGHSWTVVGASGVPRLLAIGGSAGAISVLMNLLRELPVLAVPVIVAVHLPSRSSYESALPEILARRTDMPVHWSSEGEYLVPGHVYVARQDCHTTVQRGGFLQTSAALTRPQPSVDRLFSSAATAFGAGAIGVVLSGCLSDGAVGARQIREAGGSVLVQDPRTCEQFGMPLAAIQGDNHGLVLPVRALAAALTTILSMPGADAWFQLRAGSPYLRTVADQVGLN